MIFTIIFVLVGVAVWVAAGGLLIYRHRQLRKTELMRQVETSGAGAVSAAAPGTLVELKGTEAWSGARGVGGSPTLTTDYLKRSGPLPYSRRLARASRVCRT